MVAILRSTVGGCAEYLTLVGGMEDDPRPRHGKYLSARIQNSKRIATSTASSFLLSDVKVLVISDKFGKDGYA